MDINRTIYFVHNINILNLIDIICDGPVAQSLGVEAVDKDIMKRPPRNKNKSIIDKKFIYKVLLSSATVLFITLHIFHHCMHENEITSYTTTMVCIFIYIIV